MTPVPARTPDSNSTIIITLGSGRQSNRGETMTVRVAELAEALTAHAGPEAWVVAAEFEGGHRAQEKWCSSRAIVVDIDHTQKAEPTEEERTQLEAVAAKRGATLWHRTPHGMRLWFVLTELSNDAPRFDTAAKLLCDRVDADLVGTNFSVDRGASENRAQFMWTPNALVNGVQRHAEVTVGGSSLLDINNLLPADWRPEAPAPHAERDEPAPHGQRPFADLETAVAAYRREHSIDTAMGNGDYDSLSNHRTQLSCPICRHHECASQKLKEAPDHAFCFSSNHEKDGDGCGIKTPRGYMFDIVDVHAHKAGLSRRDFLMRESWFDPAAAFQRLDENPKGVVPDRRNRLHLVTAAELAARPRRSDLWARMIQVGSLAVWYGQPKCGKSYLALALGIAIAEGKPFLGRDTIVELVDSGPGSPKQRVAKKGTVVYVCGEGASGVADKIAATIGVERLRDAADPFHQHFKILPLMPSLTNRADVEVVLEEIAKLGVQAALIVIDTVARALGAAALDENSTEDMGRFVAQLDHLRERTGAAALGIHHAGKTGIDRGSSALRGAADMFAKIERVQPRISRFVVEDMRDGEPADPIEIRFETQVVGFDAHGQVERWAVAGVHFNAESEFGARDTMDPRDREILDSIRTRQAAGDSTHRLDLEKALRISKAEANRRLKRLKQSRAVQQVGHGKTARYVESPPTQKAETEPEAKQASFDSSRLGGLQTPSQSRNPRAASDSSGPPAARTRNSKLVLGATPPPTIAPCRLSAEGEAWLREVLGDGAA